LQGINLKMSDFIMKILPIIHFSALKTAILSSLIFFVLLLNSTYIQGQTGVEAINSKIQSSSQVETDGIKPEATTEPNTLPFTLQLTHIKQFMQSTQLVFKLTNHEADMLNHFWIYVSLLDQSKGFLYREQPVLFTGIRKGGSQSIELLCESIGVDEVGYIILKPELLEIDRQEIPFETKKVELVQPGESNAKMVFNTLFK
jgi:hypothetical protein